MHLRDESVTITKFYPKS